MAFLAGANNAVLINNCQNLSNLTVQLQVTEDLITLEDTGFSVQLNCYPQIGAITPNSTQGTTFPGEVVGQLEWFQYVLIVTNNSASFEIQYWAHAKSLSRRGAGREPARNPLAAGIYAKSSQHESLASGVPRHRGNRQRRLGLLEQDSCWLGDNHRARNRQQRQRDRGDVQHRRSQRQRSIGQHQAVVRLRRSDRTCELRPLSDLRLSARSVSAPGLPVMFTSGAGTLTYSVSSGALSVQTTNTCGGIQPGTAENSNIVYQAVTPASGPYGQPVLRRSRDEHGFLFRQIDLWPG